MDFSYLLDLAKRNEESAKEAVQVKRYSTQVSASKKELRSGVQSDSVRKFLARKEQEEKQQQYEEKVKKEKLLSLRSQDRKANARVQAMLKRTKAANKGVLDDPKISQNTAVTAARLDVQPDEDDYGYVSHEASEYYRKLMNKYNSGPSTDSGSKQSGKSRRELLNAKDRVKEALHKIEEDESTVHRKRRTKKNLVEADVVPDKKQDHVRSSNKASNNGTKSAAARPKTAGGPTEAGLSFDQILKLAAAKQHEPVKFEKKLPAEVVKERRGPESERLMTKKEKDEMEKERMRAKERQLRKEGKLPPPPAPAAAVPAAPVPPARGGAKDKPNGRAPVEKQVRSIPASKSNTIPTKQQPPPPPVRGNVQPARPSGPQRAPVRQQGAPPASRTAGAKSAPSEPAVKQRPPAAGPGRMPPAAAAAGMQRKVPPSQQRPAEALANKGKTLAPAGGRPFPPPFREIRPAPQPMKRPFESDDEEEYDSELDDFIDDGPEEGNDYSKYIKEIFGYDKSRYRRIESDDEEECMESSFAQQMKEERISTKIGILEDLEDIEREEEEKKMKLLSKKVKRRK